jgi:hypothetical protein
MLGGSPLENKMRRTTYLGLVAVTIVFSIFGPACGPKNTILEACSAQDNKSDCLTIGNNILGLSEESADYECAWINNACMSQVKQMAKP